MALQKLIIGIWRIEQISISTLKKAFLVYFRVFRGRKNRGRKIEKNDPTIQTRSLQNTRRNL